MIVKACDAAILLAPPLTPAGMNLLHSIIRHIVIRIDAHGQSAVHIRNCGIIARMEPLVLFFDIPHGKPVVR